MNKVLIIAEAGVNYNGNIELAKKMVRVAKEAGADIIKFQTGKPENSISIYAEKADYQKDTTGNDESQLDMCRKLMLPDEDYPALVEECNRQGIQFMSTPFDIESVDFLASLGQRLWKIPSGEITNLPLLIHIAKRQEPIILSTGMSELSEVSAALNILKEYGAEDITVLQCNTEYPTPYRDANISAMLTLKKTFNVKVGYSDHTEGIIVPVAAVAMGATVIEKHFTLDKTMEGPDQAASIEPDELNKLVKAVRNTEDAIGNGIKSVSGSELKNRNVARKSIVARRDITKGELLTEDNLTCKRPGDGISPMEWLDVVGTYAKKNFKYDEKIEL